jgi:hypothetical protein
MSERNELILTCWGRNGAFRFDTTDVFIRHTDAGTELEISVQSRRAGEHSPIKVYGPLEDMEVFLKALHKAAEQVIEKAKGRSPGGSALNTIDRKGVIT